MKDILVRSLTGVVFIALIIVGLTWNVWSAIAVMGLFVGLGLAEFYRIFQKENEGPERFTGITGGVLLFSGLCLTWLSWADQRIIWIPAVLGALPFVVMITELFRSKNNPIQNVSLSLFSWFYIVLPLFVLILLRGKANFPFEAIFPIGMLLIVWTNDTFAFLSGKFFGKTPLFPRLSPKKTWEGTVGGLLFSLLAGYLISYFSGLDLTFWLIAALIVAPAAIIGDLFESMMKRSLNIKDSGNILPGHGGILDRFDATFFAAPLFLILHFIYF
ncbi:phosphatidate cytidylyltransferase [Wandonia haliotis]|uniref:Phosphatidate cytidylyltransferase n=1 Tax=Wandonia haliotis TaxID=574963 RepID=A0ABN1MQ91_9FLAO